MSKGRKQRTFSNLKPNQQATLFPSLGYYDVKRKCWRALVHGRVFVDGRIPIGTRILLQGLKRAMKATPEDMASETFQQRIDGFLAAPGRRRKIVLDIANHHYRLRRRTRRNGAFFGTLTLPQEVVPFEDMTHRVVPMRLLRSTDALGTISPSAGSIHLTGPTGISIVSDIDDTIKLTEATCKREMLHNTFLRPFEEVQGMSELYRYWHSMGCEFHYVSSSPWQLYEPLAELCQASGFPAGSMHLRYFRVRDEMFKRFRPLRRNTKVGIIAGIFRRLPKRKFVLVGDSGERDPEIYRFLAKRFPEQVAAILIRNLKSHPLENRRLGRLHAANTTTLVSVFERTSEVYNLIRPLITTNMGPLER